MIIISKECNPLQQELIKTIERFKIPLWPMEAFAKSMIYDINNDGFPPMNAFLEYAGGASVGPASIFVHLNGQQENNEIYEDPPFDVKWTSTPCAVFSYLVHIMIFERIDLENGKFTSEELNPTLEETKIRVYNLIKDFMFS